MLSKTEWSRSLGSMCSSGVSKSVTVGAEIADDEGDRLPEVAVGGIADESGAGVGCFADDHSEEEMRKARKC